MSDQDNGLTPEEIAAMYRTTGGGSQDTGDDESTRRRVHDQAIDEGKTEEAADAEADHAVTLRHVYGKSIRKGQMHG